MKTHFPLKGTLILLFAMLTAGITFSQCNRPYIKIDGSRVLADNSQTQNGLVLPLWLKEGQTLATDQNVNSISVIDFEVSGNSLLFNQVLSVTSTQTIPSGHVWKVESIVKGLVYNTKSSLEVTSGGTFNWTVPACVSYMCVELWGAGGGGGGGHSSYGAGGGGGGGAYAYDCFTVAGGNVYSITLGRGGSGGNEAEDGGNGGSSSLGALISANGGVGGAPGHTGGGGGAGGTSSATYNIPGSPGANRSGNAGGNGGGSANGGIAGKGASGVAGTSATAPGAGGGGGGNGSTGATRIAGNGADGKVIVTW